VTASQRTDGSHIVDVCYDLSPDDLFASFMIIPNLSIDGGETWMGLNLPVTPNILGDNVLPGENKCFILQLDDYLSNTYSSSTQFRITAEGHEALELPFELVEVAAGEYMGEEYSTSGWGGFYIDTLKTIDYSFEIMKYEVTNVQYASFLIEAKANGYLVDCTVQWFNPSGTCVYYPGETHIQYWQNTPHTMGAGDQYHSRMSDQSGDGASSDIYWNGTTFIIEEGYGDHPVSGLSYYGAWAFANYYGLRLPNKDEWIKAARGMNTWAWAYGPNAEANRANFRGDFYDYGTSGNNEVLDPWDIDNGIYSSGLETTPVGFYNGEENQWGYVTVDSPSPYGTYDQSGNVSEYTATRGDNANFIIKGGSINHSHTDAWGSIHSSRQISGYASGAPNYGGFRCVRTIFNSSSEEAPSNTNRIK
jgi:formylglycine-generating enzyme required for sulfatase activity